MTIVPLFQETPLVVAIRLAPCLGWVLFFYTASKSSSTATATTTTTSSTHKKQQGEGASWLDTKLSDLGQWEFWTRGAKHVGDSLREQVVDPLLQQTQRSSSSSRSLVEKVTGFVRNIIRPPTEAEVHTLLATYGFAFRNWTGRWWTVVTHQHVHASWQHLASNILSYTAFSMELGVVERGRQQQPPPPVVRPFFSDVWRGAKSLLFTMSVFTVGGVAGGLPAEWLYAQYQKTEAKAKFGLNNRVVKSVVGTIKHARHERMLYCGASAGICALSGFNAVYYERYWSAILTMLPCVTSLAGDLWQQSRYSSTGNSTEWFGRMQRVWSDVVGNKEVVVGQAAHVGGFVAGCLLGLGLRQWARRRQARYERQQWQQHQWQQQQARPRYAEINWNEG